MRVGLVGDTRSQRTDTAPARDLFVSPLFDARKAHVERTCDVWFILSAQHGLLHPDQRVAPYHRSLADLPRPDRERWAARVLWQLDHAFTDWRDTTVEIHAGADHHAFGLVDGLHERGAPVSIPTEHLNGGAQLAFYTEVIDLTDSTVDIRDR